MRRLGDVVLSAAALILLFPLLVLIAIVIVLDSPGNPFYRAWRVGKNGKKFRMWKFRTMATAGNAWQRGPGITSRRDARITRFGSILRRSKMDELPQFVNVLAGHMTLVGPRPEAPEFVAFYNSRQRAVLNVKPGVTGVVQIASAEESDSIPEGVRPDEYYVENLMGPKLEMDLEYLERRTAPSDAKIVASTAGMVARVIWRMIFRGATNFAAQPAVVEVATEGSGDENLDRRSV
ncbi:MAG TPA: sugar transferase [Bryobacteraceae bacterium]|nr:sugar transferase [Bryobacteraceae bacterium]